MFVQGWCSYVVVLHTCLTILNCICSIPCGPSHSLHIRRCIAVCQLSPIQWRIWTGLIFIVVLNPMPTWRHSVLDWGLLLCFLGCMAEFSHHLAGCHHTSPLITKPCLMRRVNQGVLCWLVCVWIQWESIELGVFVELWSEWWCRVDRLLFVSPSLGRCWCLTHPPTQSFVPSVGEGCLSRSSARYNVELSHPFVWCKSYSF